VAHYQSVYRGVVNYYRMALNLRDLSHLKWIMETSLTKTLAAKHGLSVRKVMAKYGTRYTADNGKTYKVLRVAVPRDGKPPLVAQWGGIPLERDMTARLRDDNILERRWNRRTELVKRLLADTRELCGSQDDIEVHHIRRLRDLRQPGRREPPHWVQVMAARQRKTLVLCHTCHLSGPHQAGTRGTVKGPRRRTSGEPGARKPASPVRRLVGGKGPGTLLDHLAAGLPSKHRLFGFISTNWAGTPLRTWQLLLAAIRGTTTKAGLTVDRLGNQQ